VHGRRVISLHICAQELATLRETDGIKPSAKFWNRGKLLSDSSELLIDISILVGLFVSNVSSLVNKTPTNPAL
jgi:hypothetical protein